MSERFSFTRGDKYVRSWQMNFPTGDKPITGSTLRIMFRASLSEAPLISKSLGAGIAITSDVAGNRTFAVTIDTADTASFSTTNPTTLIWDIEITFADSDGAYTIASGTCVVLPDVTR